MMRQGSCGYPPQDPADSLPPMFLNERLRLRSGTVQGKPYLPAAACTGQHRLLRQSSRQQSGSLRSGGSHSHGPADHRINRGAIADNESNIQQVQRRKSRGIRQGLPGLLPGGSH